MSKEKCRWVYRPGTNNSHWANTKCKGGFNYLSRLKNSEPYAGVADYYNNKLCPICGKPIEMDYSLVNDFVNK
jgi:hypothetical protein